MNYRPDIDGLRAVAVLGVILFHARLDLLPGGYVGVDVFFVISGYLITKIIVSHDGGLGDFLLRFYERRIRRLVPPALPVLAFTGIFAWLILPAPAMKEFSQSLVAYSFFVSNWFFLSISGYFDGPSHLKPLLHTWSLSVEEQFYLLFPLPILILHKRGIGLVRWFLGTIFVVSLAYSIYLLETGNSSGAFYNSIARFWEVALGGLLAVGAIRPPRSDPARALVGVAGLLAILASMILYTEETAFPGLAALIPTLGAAGVILAARGPAAGLLASRPMVGIGLISYSLYLWHWPLFVLVQFTGGGKNPIYSASAIAASFGLALASYHLIERPIRTRRILPTRFKIGSAFIATTGVIATAGLAISAANGIPSRFPAGQEYIAYQSRTVGKVAADRLRSVCWVPNVELAPVIERCVKIEPGKTNILLVGDSHAAQFYPSLSNVGQNFSISLLATDSCNLRTGFRKTCDDLTLWLRGFADSKPFPFDHIIMTSRLTKLYDASLFSELAKFLSQSNSIIVFGPVQHYNPDLPTMYPTFVGLADQSEMNRVFTGYVDMEQFKVDQFLQSEFSGSKVKYISLLGITCPQGPDTCTHFDSGGLPFTIDSSHLTPMAAQGIIDAVFERIVDID